MRIMVLCHPPSLDSQSMPLFANMIAEAMRSRGHSVTVETARSVLQRFATSSTLLKKWLRYIDQFLLFPVVFLLGGRRRQADVYVFTDQALGLWVPLVRGLPHVIHCHDFLALRSALGEIPQNPTSLTGQVYQRWIRWGFCQGLNFISISRRTRSELARFLSKVPVRSEVVNNALNYPYRPLDEREATQRLAEVVKYGLGRGFILHVGGNQWYKNRPGVLQIYEAYCRSNASPLPLLMIGAAATESMREQARRAKALAGHVHFVEKPPVEFLEAAYSRASVLLYPSIAEGFGWPIIEAMACGCLVLTTDDEPMTEIGSSIARYLPTMSDCQSADWAQECARRLDQVLALPADERRRVRAAGLAHADGFSMTTKCLAYESIYIDVAGMK